MKKVFLDDLPKWEDGKKTGKVNWRQSVGYKVNFIYEDIKNEVKIVDFKNSYLYLKYLDKDIFKIKTCHFLSCMLGSMLGKTREKNENKIEINQRFKDDKRDFIITDREYRLNANGRKVKWYKYTCNKCGFNGWMYKSHITRGIGCLRCSKQTVVGTNDIPTTTPWMVKYFQGGYDEAKLYTYGSEKRIFPICPNCGRIKNETQEIRKIYKNHSIACPCGDGQSYPNKFMFNLLEQLEIEFKTEYSPKWCKYDFKNKLRQGRYDFYFELDNKKHIIEMDGGWHKIDNNMRGQTAEESKKIDECKDMKAKEHDIEVIRIDCYESDLEYIKKNILNGELPQLLNFKENNIDWFKIHDFACKSLTKAVYDLWNSGIEDIRAISEKCSISTATVTKHLKNGNELSLCNYSNNKEHKQVICIENGMVFKSCAELERQSINLFGVKLDSSSISKVCLGVRNNNKGYTFKYIDNKQKR